MLFASLGLHSQNRQKGKVSRYETFVYTSEKIDVLIQNEYGKQSENTRGYLGDLEIITYKNLIFTLFQKQNNLSSKGEIVHIIY